MAASLIRTLCRFPISVLLVGMIYTSTKACSSSLFPFTPSLKSDHHRHCLWRGPLVRWLGLSSRASLFWLDGPKLRHRRLGRYESALSGHFQVEASAAISTLNAGYAWMGLNVFCTASYVLGMRKVMKKMNFGNWDSELCNVDKHASCR